MYEYLRKGDGIMVSNLQNKCNWPFPLILCRNELQKIKTSNRTRELFMTLERIRPPKAKKLNEQRNRNKTSINYGERGNKFAYVENLKFCHKKMSTVNCKICEDISCAWDGRLFSNYVRRVCKARNHETKHLL